MLNFDAVPKAARDAFRRERTASFIVGIYTGAIFPFIGIVARDRLRAGEFLLGLMAAAPFIGNLFSVLWAKAMEGRPKMPFAVWPWVVGRGAFILMPFAVTPRSFALTVFVSQFLVTIPGPAYAAILKAIYPDDSRGRIMSYCRVAMMVVQILSTVVAGWLLRSPGAYRYIFPIGGLSGVISAIIFSRIEVQDPDQDSTPPKTLDFLLGTFRILIDDRGFRWFALSVFTYGFANLVLSPVYPIFQVDRLHITTFQAGILTNLASILYVLSYLFWGRYVDARSPLKGTLICVFLAGIIPLNYFFSTNVWMLIPSFIVAGIINPGIELSYFNSVLSFAPEGRVSHYQALFASLLGLRGSVAPFIGSVLVRTFNDANWDIRYIFIVTLVVMWAGGFMQLVGVRGKYRSA